MGARVGLMMALVLLAVAVGVVRAAGEAIDWDRARALLQKENRHQPLTPEEQAYLDHAKEVRARTMNAPAAPKESLGLKPLTELGDGQVQG